MNSKDARKQAGNLPRRTQPSSGESSVSLDAARPIRAFSLRGSLSPLLLGPMVLPALIVLLAPTNIIDLWPWAARFVQFVQGLIPGVDVTGHAKSTVYVQPAILAHSMTLIVIPITSLVWLWQSVSNYPRLLARRRILGYLTFKQHLGLMLVGPPAVILMMYLIVVSPGDPSFARGLTTNSRFGFAFVTFFATYATSLILGNQVLNLRLFIDTHIKGKD